MAEKIRHRLAQAKARRDFEQLDPTPVTLNASQARPPSLKEMIQTQIRTALSQIAEERGAESFEDADDFEEPDPDPEWFSPHELRNQTIDENTETLDGVPEPDVSRETSGDHAEGAEPDVANSNEPT